MSNLDDFHQRVQSYLIKKDPEVGSLKFLSSRTTEENCRHIDELCGSFAGILTSYKIPIGEDASPTSVECVQALKYLLLNTNFKSQDYLLEDILHGHLVDMCPPLSSYLLVEIVCHLHYEKILAEFILHWPLDLCNEILETFRRFLHLLDFKRGFSVLLDLVRICYLKVIQCHDFGTQSMDFETNLEGLILNCQEILTCLGNKKYTRLEEVTEIHRSERCGYILRDILALIINCLAFSQKSPEITEKMTKLMENKKWYTVTFGREPLKKIPSEEFVRHMRSLDLELAAMLLKKVKEISCSIYLDWASLEADGNPSVSLQQSVGVECFKLIEFLRNSEGQEHLLECLQHLAVDPKSLNPCAMMTIRGLCDELANGNKNCLKELLRQNDQWDASVVNSLRNNLDFFDKEDFLNLLEYLVTLMRKEGQEDYKQTVYNLVTKVLIKQNLKDVYEVTLSFILKNDAVNVLESAYTEPMFEKFLLNNSDFKSPPKLRILLFFLMKNPAKFLTILLKCCVCCEEHKNILINPEDMILLSPIMNIREETGKLGLNCLRKIATDEFNPKKFDNLVKAMLKNSVFSIGELIDSVYVPWLEDQTMSMNTVRTILNSARQQLGMMMDVSKDELLLKALAKRMTLLRNDRTTAKYLTSELLTSAARVVQAILAYRDDWFMNAERRRWIIETEARLQPIDKFNFQKLFSETVYFDVCDIVEDYLRIINEALVRATPATEDVPPLNREKATWEIMKHLILSSTEIEFVRIASEITVIHYDYFDCQNEIEAFDKILKVTMEAVKYALQGPWDHFGLIIKALAKFVRRLINVDLGISKIPFLQACLENFSAFRDVVAGSEFEELYQEVLVKLNNRPSGQSTAEALAETVNSLVVFGDKYLEMKREQVEKGSGQGEGIRQETDKYMYQELIRISLEAADGRQSCMMRRVWHLLLSNPDD